MHVGLFIGSFFVVGIVILIFMLKFRCPHCGEIPRGRAIDISGGITYSKGIHPFPSRCASCGFYLQVRALKRDMKQQEIQYQQSQELVEERSE